ncbi:hypothetical protein ACFOWX_10895 [Sphingorhabdus arenilitoris]|uniref:Uncharacterized protein n=1 Tax=Sphingorhabdus arenilitoris TaxID=1490041 RepID=A0ABV8RJP5_9SPHN
MTHKYVIGLSLLVAAVTTSGCTENKVAALQDGAAADASKAAEHGGKEHRTVKVGAGLSFTHDMPTGTLQPGGSYSTTVKIVHGYTGGTLSLTANADDGLTLGARQTAMQLAKGSAASWTIPFKTSANGVYYINMVGTVTKADGASEARAYSIRVEVGDQSRQQKPALKEVILPAEEQISE